MTLARQLIVLTLFSFALVFAGTFAISVLNARAYIAEQLASHAGDTATSLALSLGDAATDNDVVLASRLMDAIFDSGDYRAIVLRNMQGKPLVKRQIPVVIEGVPSWFVSAVHLETPAGEALVMAGWNQWGTLEVRSHPGYAYQRLWHSSLETLGWFSVVSVLAVLLGLSALRILLRPLHGAERQAEAICERRFPMQEKLPRTRELRRIVEAMNRMTAKLRRIFAEQEALAQDLRDEALRDPVTGLGNRRFFEQQLVHRLDVHQEGGGGWVALIQLKGFKAFNDCHGYLAGDELLAEVARLLNQVQGDFNDFLLARLGGADFGAMVSGLSRDQGELLARALHQALSRLSDIYGESLVDAGHVGVTSFEPGGEVSELLGRADMALQSARGCGPNGWQLFHSSDEARPVRGARQWRSLLEGMLKRRDIQLLVQPVCLVPDRGTLHREVFARLPDGEGGWLSAAEFLPNVARWGMAPILDQLILEQVLEHLRAVPGEGILAVNLSVQSVMDHGFVEWLEGRLKAELHYGPRLCLEWPEYGALVEPQPLQALVDRLRPLGVRFGLDHFGRGFGSYAHLHSLRLDYLKVDGSFVRGLDSHADHRFFLRALADIAHTLDMKLIAETVEDQAEWHLLSELSVDGGQGYFLGRPISL